MVFDYIETFYNPRRRHSALDYRSPAQFEDWLCSQREGCSGGGSKGGETCLTEQVGSSRLCCEQLRGVVQAAGNNPVQSPQSFQSSNQTINPNQELKAQSAFSKKDQVRHYTLSSEDLALINRRRGDPNRLGFALMLCYLHFPGRILQQGEQPPAALCKPGRHGA